MRPPGRARPKLVVRPFPARNLCTRPKMASPLGGQGLLSPSQMTALVRASMTQCRSTRIASRVAQGRIARTSQARRPTRTSCTATCCERSGATDVVALFPAWRCAWVTRALFASIMLVARVPAAEAATAAKAMERSIIVCCDSQRRQEKLISFPQNLNLALFYARPCEFNIFFFQTCSRFLPSFFSPLSGGVAERLQSSNLR